MAQTALTEFTPIGDIVIHEHHSGYCRESKTVTNSTGAAIDLAPGHPMDDNVPVVAGDEANTDGILMERAYIPNGASAKVAVLARGPAVINQDALPSVDYDGDALTLETIVTALEALEDIVCREEPDLQETQDT